MHKPTPLNINELFSKTHAIMRFSAAQPIPAQLKAILRAKPKYVVQYACYPEGHEKAGELIQVRPKPVNVKTLMKAAGLTFKFRGIGYTRRNKKQTKAARKTAAASRKRNRK